MSGECPPALGIVPPAQACPNHPLVPPEFWQVQDVQHGGRGGAPRAGAV